MNIVKIRSVFPVHGDREKEHTHLVHTEAGMNNLYPLFLFVCLAGAAYDVPSVTIEDNKGYTIRKDSEIRVKISNPFELPALNGDGPSRVGASRAKRGEALGRIAL